MNSDQPISEATTPPASDAPTTRRRSTRRTPAQSATTAEPQAAPDAAVAATAAGDAPAVPPRRSRSRRTAAAQDAPPADAAPPVAASVTAAPSGAAPIAPAAQSAAPSGAATLADEPAEAAPRSRRRRRGRGTRGAAETLEAANGDDSTYAPVLEPSDIVSAAAVDEVEEAEDAESPAATGRRRRRRGRGGRGAGEAAETSVVVDGVAVPAMPEEVSSDGAAAPPVTTDSASPAVLRRFDRRDWRGGTPAPSPSRARAPLAAVAAPPVPTAPAAMPDAEAPRTDLPAERTERAAQPTERRTSRFSSQPARDIAQFSTPPPAPAVEPPAPRLAVEPSVPRTTVEPSAPRTAMVPAAVAAPLTVPGEGTNDRLERLIAGQTALLQQQQQALQSMTATMETLQRAIERMTTSGIAAGMPRAGVFVDAPNVVYAAENARVALDYGRMLDFLCRGREMVHAIVYAPVTEESGFRFEGQRFVAPFLHKGYKLVTKPLKRFPDGTAKGNFDIELAIDIVTMSQRLDVVILISGDSDFSRLIELIQSRGVRVEVVAFASNVSWELVQMADVFIDIGAYLPEFRPA